VHAGFHRILEFAARIKIRRDKDLEEFEGRKRFGVTSQKSSLGGGVSSYLARKYQEIEGTVEVSRREKH
jgi:hypothetical protein